MANPLPVTVANWPPAAPAQIQPWFHWAQPDATIVAAGLATMGWLYAARRSRALAKKQHTLNVLMQTGFNKEFRDAEEAIFPLAHSGHAIDVSDPDCPHRASFKVVLNHYEFVAAGLRNGDFDERMILDTMRGAILTLYERCESGIFKLRTDRRRQTLYEHIEWLQRRWERAPPGVMQRLWEWVISRPLGGSRKNPRP